MPVEDAERARLGKYYEGRKVSIMALNWNFNERIGRLLVVEEREYGPVEFNINIYRGNAFMIFLYEYEKDGEELYQMYNFFIDKEHAKNCMNNSPSIFDDWKRLELWDFNKKDIWLIGELADRFYIECELKPNVESQYEFH